jgi:photosystem II stability/assembly factor-like uncharacterized protein
MKKSLILILLLVSINVAYSQWEPCNDGLLGASARAIIYANNSLYLGVFGGGVYISTDMGENWVEKNNGLTNLYVRCLQINGSNILAGTSGGGVFLSTDNGESWSAKNSGFMNLDVRSIVRKDNKIFAGTAGGGIYISDDNGENWLDENPVDSTDKKRLIITIAVCDGYIIAGTANKGVFVSSDDGLNWVQKNSGILEDPILVYSSAVKDNLLYIGTGGGLYKSENHGEKWTNLNVTTFSASISSIAVSDSLIVASRSADIFVSNDKGASWKKKSYNQLIQTLLIVNNKIYTGTYGGVNLSTDLGETWIRKNNNLKNTSIMVITNDKNNIFVGTYGNGMFLSTDNGNSWVEKNSGFRNNMSSGWIYALNAKDNVIMSGTDDGLYLSTDTGKNWLKKSLTTGIPSISSFVRKDNYIFAGLSQGAIWRSSDNGKNWELNPTSFLNTTYPSVLATDGTNLFAGANLYNGGFFISTDNGENWIPKTSGFTLNIYSIVVYKDVIYAGSDFGMLSYSTDLGDHWTTLSPNANSVAGEYSYSLAVVGNNIFLGTNFGLYFSSDKGNSWEKRNDGLKSTNIRALSVKGDTIYAGTIGGGMYRAKLSDFGITDVKDNTINTDNYLYTYPPFPNPATKEVRSLVYWDMSSDIEHDEIGIYNIYGAKVSDRSKISFDKLNLYSGYLIWNCAGIETGVYMIVIKHGTETRTIKVVVN